MTTFFLHSWQFFACKKKYTSIFHGGVKVSMQAILWWMDFDCIVWLIQNDLCLWNWATPKKNDSTFQLNFTDDDWEDESIAKDTVLVEDSDIAKSV